MAVIAWSDVTDQAPELTTVSVPAQTAILATVNTTIVNGPLGGETGIKTFEARVYLAAHIATMLKRRGIAGFRSSQSAGGVSESFSPILVTRYGAFAATSYGVLYAQIVGTSAHRAGFLVGSRRTGLWNW